jgi:hypothetical protein
VLSLIGSDERLTEKENEICISSEGDRCSIGRGDISTATKRIDREEDR